MNMDEIENKIQLEIINVNKTIANKRRGNESKENINLRANMIFCMASKQSKEERGKRKKEKKRKEKKKHFRLNHAESPYTCHPERKRMPGQIK
jgi:hypothetical protein